MGRADRRELATSLGTRPVGPLLWSSTSQATLSVTTYGVYALTNAWFVSRGVGTTAFVAVNLVAPVLLVIGAVSTTVGAGGASLVSRSLGAGDPRGAARAAGNAFLVYWTAAVVIGGLGVLLIDPLLTLLGATGATRGLAHDYGVIILAGALTGTGFSSLVRAEGRMRFSTALWVVAVVCQIVLDPLLIFGFDLGVRGAALGTVGGQAVSVAMSLWFFFVQRDRPYRITLADLRPHGPTLRALLSVGAPSFLAGFGATLVVALVNNLLVATGGPVALSAYAICGRIGTFVLMPHLGISQGMQPLIGYNAGRALTARVHRARTLALRASVVYGTAACLVLLVAAGPLTATFTDDPAVHREATSTLRILALGYPLAGVATLVSAYFQALGRARPSYAISVGSIAAIRVPLLLVFSLFGTLWLWISIPLAEAVAAGAALLVLRRLGSPREPGRERTGPFHRLRCPGRRGP
ncbi:MATE family efflux transporter [Streptomyces sp. SBT349]|uniref:MATE family efflux transporter n=1 Tax=Streptomyces sp. SBT349 TaxID=1580539 RepID=UPI00066AD259|nr:MATE family efflux transporter [Streptomyces sp. SBT349]